MFAITNHRPVSHFSPPHSWSNDPCGAVFIPETREYLLCYQWNPGTTDPGNSAWGMAKSKDLITWVDCKPALSNGVETQYDSCGVFSGSIFSRIVGERRMLYLFYTSVSALPIHWSKKYTPGSETQSVTISTDYGRSWQRYQHNPLLKNPPFRELTTGWRDPFVSTWDTLSRLRDVPLSTCYMLIASGEKSQGPRLLLYESQDLFDWKPLSTLLKGVIDAPIVPGSSLEFGRNFECASFFTIGHVDYIIAGIEEHPSHSSHHASRYTLWMSGVLRLDSEGQPRFVIDTFGRLDHGIFYAPHTFRGSKNEILQLGWADEDMNNMIQEQGFAGCLALPREVIQIRVPVPRSLPTEMHTWKVDSASSTMTTLGFKPAGQLRNIRSGSKHYNFHQLSELRSKNFEIKAKFTCLLGNEKLIFNVRQATDNREVTRIVVALFGNTVTIDRSASSLTNGNNAPVSGSFELLNLGTAQRKLFEDLEISIFVDSSIIEVYVNNRFAITSRIYPSLENATRVSYDFRTADGTDMKGSEGLHLGFDCWEGLAMAWPGRLGAAQEDVAEREERRVETDAVLLPAQAVAA